MNTTVPPTSTSVLFARGVIARLSIWAALRIAVENNWGGAYAHEKRTWIASVLVDTFDQDAAGAPDVQYVEEMLLQIMEDEFETVLEDGSALRVAEDVVRLWREVCAGGVEMVLRLEQQADGVRGKRVVAQEGVSDDDAWESDSGDEDSGSEEGEDEAPALVDQSRTLPQVDEDGFTIVRGRGKTHR
jgi:pre-rRNA-processing protein TSR2